MDYFDTLEIDRTASQAEIKQAFRRLAAKYHPDRNREDSAHAKFQSIQEAYSVLGDPKKRKKYIEAEFTTVVDPRSFVKNYWEHVISISE